MIRLRVNGQETKARVEIMKYLDDRDSTAIRIPSPEVWARLELEYRF